jgi:hypothetical protein
MPVKFIERENHGQHKRLAEAADIIFWGFSWSSTPEGWEYWAEVKEKIEQLAHLEAHRPPKTLFDVEETC